MPPSATALPDYRTLRPPATVADALNSVDQVSVSGNAGGAWTVAFGGTRSIANVVSMRADAPSLTSGTRSGTIGHVDDAASQLPSISDPDSSYPFTYDALGRLLTVDNNGTPDVPRVVMTSA